MGCDGILQCPRALPSIGTDRQNLTLLVRFCRRDGWALQNRPEVTCTLILLMVLFHFLWGYCSFSHPAPKNPLCKLIWRSALMKDQLQPSQPQNGIISHSWLFGCVLWSLHSRLGDAQRLTGDSPAVCHTNSSASKLKDDKSFFSKLKPFISCVVFIIQ